MNALAIYIKNNVKGKVKTRIAQEVGNEKASEIYDDLITYTHRITSQIPVSKYVFYSDEVGYKDLWDKGIFNKNVQVKGDLGDRMQHSFEELLNRHKKAILIGSDCTQLVPGIILSAYNLLSKCDVVLGPSLDGGYYLIGMKYPHKEIFQDIDWSTDKVLTQTIDKIVSLRLSYKLLTTLSDIDYISDLKSFPI